MKPFLTAHWRYLAMLNFRVAPDLLAPYLPAGTELDFFQGESYLSVVGFLFYHTVVCGLPIPRHRNFEEVNLRFYVLRKPAQLAPETWRRGVFYGEPYQALPMRSEVIDRGGEVSARYEWRRGNKWEHLAMTGRSEPQNILAGSHEEFITEHYWGYTRRGPDRTSEYRVEHPRWKVWAAASWEFRADVVSLYGEKFVGPLSCTPASAFIADGSFVTVYRRGDVGDE